MTLTGERLQFESAVESLLLQIRDILESRLDVIALRGSLHFRSDRTYKDLVVRNFAENPTLQSDWLKPSSTVWSLIESHECPVLLNLQFGSARILATQSFDRDLGGDFDQSSSMRALTDRDTSHVLGLPIFDHRSQLVGILSIECRGGLGLDLFRLEEASDLGLKCVAEACQELFKLRKPNGVHNVLPIPSLWCDEQFSLLNLLANVEDTVLLRGESGTGKTFLARWMHEHGNREGQFVEAHLNQMTDDMSLPHFFGWKKGAYTGSVQDNVGWATAAEGGTLFIDEVDTLSAAQQRALLQIMEGGAFTVAGSAAEQRLKNVRLVMATNSDLETLVAHKDFRSDLYYRINMLPLEIPPMRDRTDEVMYWVEYFANQRQEVTNGCLRYEIDEDVSQAILRHPLPGNLRSIKNLINSACLKARVRGDQSVVRVQQEDIEPIAREPQPGSSPIEHVYHAAKEVIRRGISVGQLENAWLKQKGILHDMIWLVAVEQLGDSLLGNKKGRDVVAELLHKQAALANNNYGAELKRAMRRLSERYLEEQAPPPPTLELLLRD